MPTIIMPPAQTRCEPSGHLALLAAIRADLEGRDSRAAWEAVRVLNGLPPTPPELSSSASAATHTAAPVPS